MIRFAQRQESPGPGRLAELHDLRGSLTATANVRLAILARVEADRPRCGHPGQGTAADPPGPSSSFAADAIDLAVGHQKPAPLVFQLLGPCGKRLQKLSVTKPFRRWKARAVRLLDLVSKLVLPEAVRNGAGGIGVGPAIPFRYQLIERGGC